MGNIRLRYVFLFFIWTFFSLTVVRSCEESHAEVISAVRHYFRSGCVFLMTQQNEPSFDLFKKTRVLKMLLLLSKKQMPTAVLDIRNYTFIPCTRNRGLNVILNDSENTYQSLLLLFTRKDVSESRWLLFMSNSTSIAHPLGAVNIPFNCVFLVAVQPTPDSDIMELTEVYRINRTLPLLTHYWGSWNIIDGLTAPKSSLYERRNNLQGIVLNAAAYEEPPFNVMWQGDDGEYYINGFFPKIMHELSALLNFSLKVHLSDDNSFGYLTEDGRWRGAIGMMINGTIDLTMVEGYITSDRTYAIDYTVPLLSTRSCIYIHVSPEISWWAYLSPFSGNIWMAIGGVILVSTGCLSFSLNISESLLCTIGAFCQQGFSALPRTSSGRLLLWTTLLSAAFVFTVYSAVFISFLTVRQVSLPFTSLEGIAKNEEYDFGVTEDTPLFNNFYMAKDPITQAVYEKKIHPYRHKQPLDNMEGFTRCCTSKYAFMTDCDYYKIIDTVPCTLEALPEASFPLLCALGFAKGSPYLRLINLSLQKMVRSGLIQKLFLSFYPSAMSKFQHQGLKSLELNDVIAILLICLAGCGFSATILLLEIVRKKKRNKKRQYLRRNAGRKRASPVIHFITSSIAPRTSIKESWEARREQ